MALASHLRGLRREVSATRGLSVEHFLNTDETLAPLASRHRLDEAMALTSIPRGPHERSRMMREVEGLCLERVRAEPFDRHKQSETGQDKIDRKHLQLAAPQVGGAGAEHQIAGAR